MKTISGKNINLRLCEVDDAAYIVALRQNKHLTQFLMKVDADEQQQKSWLEKYKQREKDGLEYYFIIEDKSAQKIGTIRLQEIDRDKKSFTLGSFIVDKNNSPKYSSLEAITLLFDFAFNQLNLEKCNFYCRNENYMATAFYEKYKAPIISRDEENTYYLYDKKHFLQQLPLYMQTINKS